ncbi:MAG: hypothetical protein CV089_08095 [Nitrospira sp. WS110]|nr:hypothetical protein [Nitrospira sp. WS110]
MKMLTDLPDDSCSAYTFSDYVVWVVREENEVRLTMQNKSHDEGGGSIWLPSEIAAKLGHALTLLSSPDTTESELERIKIMCQDPSLGV